MISGNTAHDGVGEPQPREPTETPEAYTISELVLVREWRNWQTRKTWDYINRRSVELRKILKTK